MKFAVIKTGGKQYKVHEGDQLKIEKISNEIGSTYNFQEVLLTADGESIDIGQPFVKSEVTAKVIDQGKGKKVRVVKYKAKIRYKKVYGHRQPYTKVQIEKIA